MAKARRANIMGADATQFPDRQDPRKRKLRTSMNERYDSTAAKHYAAFRPPLHSLILDRVMRPDESFQVGLDVAQQHPKITYLQGSGDALGQLVAEAIDVVTFAGSLFYVKTERLRRELVRACPPGASIVVYDFEVLFHEVMAELRVDCPAVASDYDHRVNLSDWYEFSADCSGAERLRLDVTGREMAHLLLADSNRYDALVERFSNGDPFESLVGYLDTRHLKMGIDADIYFTRYRVLGGMMIDPSLV
ncbi:MAG: hypothetical protein ACK57G_21050 [Planctomycetota bacterium]|jgi:hypothetical protein